jgi:hypothetical protein
MSVQRTKLFFINMNSVTDIFNDERGFVARGSYSDEIYVNRRRNTAKMPKRGTAIARTMRDG